MSRVLVAYATKYGSTAEVAEKVAERLRSRGLDVDVKAARDAQSVGDAEAVVLGAPLYVGSLLKDATKFLNREREALLQMPVAVFAVGPVRAEQIEEDGGKQLDDALKKSAPWLQPVSKATFVGAYDPGALRGVDKLAAKLKASPLYGVPKLDERDWGAIGAWADDLAGALSARD